jgi:hypothetical protein
MDRSHPNRPSWRRVEEVDGRKPDLSGQRLSLVVSSPEEAPSSCLGEYLAGRKLQGRTRQEPA